MTISLVLLIQVQATLYIYMIWYGSRSKTHARLLVSEWRLQIFLLQWRKAAKGRSKVRERSEYHYFCQICTRKHDPNSVSRFCSGAQGRERAAQGQFWGTIILNNPRTYIHTCMHACMHTYIHTNIHTYIQTHTHIYIYIHTYKRDTNMSKKVWPARRTRKKCAKCWRGCRKTFPKP